MLSGSRRWRRVVALVAGLVASLLITGRDISTAQAVVAGTTPFSVNTDVRQEALRWGTDGSTTGVVFRYRADGVATGSPCGTTSCGVSDVGAPVTTKVSAGAAPRLLLHPVGGCSGAAGYNPAHDADDAGLHRDRLVQGPGRHRPGLEAVLQHRELRGLLAGRRPRAAVRQLQLPASRRHRPGDQR